MRTSTMMIALALALVPVACGKQGGEESAPVEMPPAPSAAGPAPAETVSESPVAAAPEPTVPPPAGAAATAQKAVTAAPAGAALDRDAALALAQQSGCVACHKIEAKLVGPAWQDVSAKYKGDAGAKAMLIAKVKAGGQGNWTEVTGGMPMPPYSPRVPDESIEELVAFILSL
jgi:cytochrome c